MQTLAASAEALNAQFLVNVGDNHYYYGVKSSTDSAWKTNFEDVYTAKSLAIPWYSVLGNRKCSFRLPTLLASSGSDYHWHISRVTDPDLNIGNRLHPHGVNLHPDFFPFGYSLNYPRPKRLLGTQMIMATPLTPKSSIKVR